MVLSVRAGARRSSRSAKASPAVLAVLLLLLGACAPARAAAPDRSEQLLSPLPPRSASCDAEPRPAELPGVDMVVDSAMLAAAVRELREQDPAPTGYALYTLAFDPEGLNIRRDLIEHNTRPMIADSIQRLVFAARRQVEESEQEWGVRLRVDLTDPVMLRVGRREFCPPVPRSREVAEAMQRVHLTGPRFRGGMRERTVHMRALVNSSGFITSAHVARGELRGSTLEREIAQYLRQFFFIPATLDGVPTGAWVTIPIRVRV